MDTKTYKILVPTDFTDVAECAVNHAAKSAEILKGEIFLLHIVKKQKDIKEKKLIVEEKSKKYQSKYNIKFTPLIRVGSIFEDIGAVAAENDCRLIVMGTHGVKGIQYITGSYALRVIANSKIPFIIVQKKPVKSYGYKNIVFPVDLTKETKQKITLTTNFARHFGSKIHIFAPKEKDTLLKEKLKNNVVFVKKFFSERAIPYDIKVAESKGNFKKQLINYAASIDADIIAIVNTKEDDLLPDFFGRGEEQQIIANDAQIPVLVMNPTLEYVSTNVLFS